jgi:hypothetical protein
MTSGVVLYCSACLNIAAMPEDAVSFTIPPQKRPETRQFRCRSRVRWRPALSFKTLFRWHDWSTFRWYQDPTFAAESIPAVCRHGEPAPQEFRLPTRTIRSAFASNPIDNTSHDTTPPPRTQTVPARDVFHNVQAAIRPLIAGIQTREQVSDLIQSLGELQCVSSFHILCYCTHSCSIVNEILMKLAKSASLIPL